MKLACVLMTALAQHNRLTVVTLLGTNCFIVQIVVKFVKFLKLPSSFVQACVLSLLLTS